MSRLFSIFSGSSAGKQDSSIAQIGNILAGESRGQAPQHVYINAATGNFYFEDFHHRIEDLGLLLDVGYRYNSQHKSWIFSLGKTLKPLQGTLNSPNSSITLLAEDGHECVFHYDDTKKAYVYESVLEGTITLTSQTDGSWEAWNPSNGCKEHYDSSGAQQDRVDAVGRKMQFTYDENHKLTQIQLPSGQMLSFQYSATQIILQLDSQILATVDIQGDQITASHFPLDATTAYSTQFSYDSVSGMLSGVTQDDQTNFSIAYDASLRVQTVTDGEKRSHQLNYSALQTQVIDPLQQSTTVHFNTENQITSVDKIGSLGETEITGYTYTPEGRVQSELRPNAAEPTEYTYDLLGCRDSTTDPLGNVEKVYRDALGAIIAMSKDLLTTYFVNDEKRQCLFSISPSGQVEALNYDANSNLIGLRTFVNAFYPVSTLTPGVAIAVEVLQSWCQQQDLSQTRLGEFKSNARGQRIDKLHYAHVDTEGNGVVDDSLQHESATWDAFGCRLTHTVYLDQHTSALTSTQYDGLHRCTMGIDPLKNITQTEYQDAKQTVMTTAPNSLTTSTTWDKSGQSASVTTSDGISVRTQTMTYDLSGRPHSIQLPDGQTRYQWFDAQNRLLLDVDERGFVTHTIHDDQNQVTDTIQYARAVADAQLSTLTSAQVIAAASDPTSDRRVTELYDAAERSSWVINGEGGVTQTFYNASNQPIQTIAYATPWPDNQPRIWPTSPYPTSTDDRSHFYYYEAGQLVGEQDAQGYVTTYIRNSANQVTSQYRYATSIALSSTLSLPDKVPGKDIEEFFYYDARGREIGHVDGENYLTENIYDGLKKPVKTIRYATAVHVQAGATLEAIRPISNSEDRVKQFQYDLRSHVIHTDTSFGMACDRQYDNMGHLIFDSREDSTQASSARTTLARYNAFGQVTAQLNEIVSAQVAQIQASSLPDDQKQQQIEQLWKTASTRFVYDDASGLMLSRTTPTGQATFYYYNASRQPVVSIDSNGGILQYDYAGFDAKPLRTRRYQTPYDASAFSLQGGFLTQAIADQLQAWQLPTDNVKFITRDRCGRMISQTDAVGFVQETHRNVFGECFEEYQPVFADLQAPKLVIEREYDHRGHCTKTTQDRTGLNIVTSAHYGVHGKADSTTDGNQHTTAITHDRLGRETAKTDPLQHTQSVTFDAFSRPLTETNAMKQTTAHTHDQTSRTHTITSPLGKIHTTVENAFHEVEIDKTLLSSTDAILQTTSHEVDGQIQTVVAPEGQQTDHAYDNAGRPTSRTDPPPHPNTPYYFTHPF